ncbi:hypothetical protein ACJVEK_16500 [Enterobacter hormaechei subsp. xiangfangensis]|uniref:hypothetical protein n=1 Tax=Enterobacter hormaechei TaxID=158836 RepID=UPI003DA22F3F
MECNVSELVKRGHDQVAELKASCGAVGVRDVAQLISDLATQLDVQLARSNALAAENAGLKEYLAPAGLAVEGTPATEAFLDEVRAQGVEMLRDYIAEIEGGIEDTIDLHHYCSDFAAEVRKGVQS